MPIQARQSARRLTAESGQETLEWTGLLVLAAAIVTLFFSLGLPGKVARAVVCAVGEVLRSEVCGAGPGYPVSATTKTVGYDGRVTFVDAGHQYVVTLTKLSNGTATISLVNTGSVGVSARIGAEVELGPLGGAEAQAQAGGGVFIDGSTTWTFPNWGAAEQYWGKVSSGNSAGLAVNDAAGSLPLFGHALSGVVDAVTGAKGAPSVHSISSKYLTATAVGGGIQGSASGDAGVDAGPINAGIKASINAQGGLERVNSGPQKGDWEGSVKLSVDGDGSLGEVLFGSHAGAGGSLDGEATVTFSPNGIPEELEVTATGDGVWEAAGPSSDPPDGSVKIPGSDESGDGNSEPGGEKGGEGGTVEGGKSEPVLDLSHDSSGGSGVGSSFVGRLDLSNDPQARAALESLLTGNTSQIPVLVSDMNAHGTEIIQTYHLDKSSSTWGGQVNVGGGGGAEFDDGSSTACYDPPRVRQNGGPWTTASFGGDPGC